jgi:hypothetical protein
MRHPNSDSGARGRKKHCAECRLFCVELAMPGSTRLRIARLACCRFATAAQSAERPAQRSQSLRYDFTGLCFAVTTTSVTLRPTVKNRRNQRSRRYSV